ncbi:MAG: 30S ribosomal protein S6 [Deltaproteobacteria bacterium]|jgi:small subunit ribosomal protein S6|nr:30S ribosomal protein S6 [Deltaproteobacteria bacterium]
MFFRRYETLILLSPHLTTDQLAAFKGKVEGILAKGEGQVVRLEERGRQKLAYPVRRELFGYYLLYDYRAKSSLAAELERNLKIDEQVFKYLTLVQDKNFTEEKYQTVLANIASEAARREKEQAQAAEAREAAQRAAAEAAAEAAAKAAAEAEAASETAAEAAPETPPEGTAEAAPETAPEATAEAAPETPSEAAGPNPEEGGQDSHEGAGEQGTDDHASAAN